MPSNSTGQLAIWQNVDNVASFTLSPQDTGVRVRQVRAPTTIDLPEGEFPNDGDFYEVQDADGSCSLGNNLVVVPPTGTTIRGAATLVLSDPFVTCRLVFNGETDDWTAEIAATPSSSALSTWTEVPAGATFAPTAAQTFLSCDSTGAQTTVNLPAAAALFDGQIQLVKLVGGTVTPVIVNAGAGTSVEQLNDSGTFGAQTYLTDQGQAAFFKYDKAATEWKAYSLYDGNAAAAQAQATWEVDPQNVQGTSANTNNGLTAATAVLNWAEVIRRTKTLAWTVTAAAMAVTFLSSHTDNSDPVLWDPIIASPASVVLKGAPAATTAAIFTLNAAKSRAAGANAALSGSFSAGVPAKGVLVTNTTGGKSSRAYIYKAAGGANWTLTQPLVPEVPPLGFGFPVEVDTWASLDTVTLSTQIAVNIVRLNPTLNTESTLQVYNLVAFDPGAAGNILVANTAVQFIECAIQRLYAPIATNVRISTSLPSMANNTIFLAPVLQTSTSFAMLGGALVSNFASFGSFNGTSNQFDADVIIGGASTTFSGLTVFGMVYLDTTITCEIGEFRLQTGSYGGHVLYGSAAGNISLRSSSRLTNASGTFTAAMTAPTLITGLTINGGTTAHSVVSGSPDVFYGGITVSVANLDAAAGVAGFGGTAFNPGGASISNQA